MCASSGKRPAANAGKFGDYVCDSPWHLINSSVYAMKSILPNPDFIVWTGYVTFFKWILQDSASLKTISGEINACLPLQSWYFQISIWYWHVWLQLILKQSAVLLLSDDTPHVDNKDLGEDAVLNIINNLTDIINQVFPSNYKIRRKHARSTHMIVF